MTRNSILSGLINIWLCLLAAWVAGCAPTTETVAPTAVTGCSNGGPGIYTPADVQCYLASADNVQVQTINQETIMLLADSQNIDLWAGAAIIYHTPTRAMLVLDQFGDGLPQASHFTNRAGLAALSDVAGNAALMAGIKQQMQQEWQTAPTNEPQILLSAAWQDGDTTIFFIAITGLAATDDRFYCPTETWIIGNEITEISSECIAHETGTPVSHLLFVPREIRGTVEQPVQVALNGVASNTIQVSAGTVATETAVYQTVLQHLTNRPLLIRGETASDFQSTGGQLAAVVDPALLEAYTAVNAAPISLRFLFYDSNAYSVQPSEVIRREYLPEVEPQPACAQFRNDYPRLGGIVTFSQIGFNDDASQALVHALHECGSADRQAAYFILVPDDTGWQVSNTITAATELPLLTPQLTYSNQAAGCGDIFLYKSNTARSEYITVFVNAAAFDFASGPVTINLADHAEDAGVRIEVYADNVEKLGENPYCNDVGPSAHPQSVWTAVSGTLNVTTTAVPPVESCIGEPYQATIHLEDVVFAAGEETVHLPSIQFNEVTVGWCPG